MILAARLNGLGAVELLEGHDAGQMVRKGHLAHGKLKIGEPLDLRRNAERRADEKAGAGTAAAFRLPQRIRL